MSAISNQQSAISRRIAGFGGALLAVASLLVVCAPPSGAQEQPKIGYVDLLKVFDGYEKTKALDTSLEQKGKQKQTELEGRVGELKKLRQNLELLNDQARDLRAREIEEKSDELQRFRTNAARDITRERDKLTKGLLNEIQAGVEEYAKANGFALIMDQRALLYSVQAYDVTDAVLALLNSRVKKPR